MFRCSFAPFAFVMRCLVVFCLALLGSSGLVQGQTWTPPARVATGWFPANPDGCSPGLNEATEASRMVVVPLPPDGADLVLTRLVEVRYRTTIEGTNVSTEDVLTFGSATFNYCLGHEPGLYVDDNHLYLAGHGTDQSAAAAQYVIGVSAGGGTWFEPFEAGETATHVYQTTFPNLTTADVAPISPEWLEPTRRGGHGMFVTGEGSSLWGWSWQDGTAPPGWNGSHAPVSRSSSDELLAVWEVSYGSYPE